jgi:hypothetical protein
VKVDVDADSDSPHARVTYRNRDGRPTPIPIPSIRKFAPALRCLRDGLKPPSAEIPDSTRHFAHVAYPLLTRCSTVREVIRELVTREQVAESTAYKWLCDRNPLYEPGGAQAARFHRLKTAVRRIYAFTQSP